MRLRHVLAGSCAMWVSSLLLPALGVAQVNIGINIGTPPPPAIVIPAPPRVVVIPGSPVYYAPEVPHNYFVYGGKHYVVRDGAWYYAPAHHGPWTFLPVERVPRHVRRVPVAYYRTPPGHRQEHREHRREHREHRSEYREHPGKGHKHKHKDKHHDHRG